MQKLRDASAALDYTPRVAKDCSKDDLAQV
jgi:hypothetical protein